MDAGIIWSIVGIIIGLILYWIPKESILSFFKAKSINEFIKNKHLDKRYSIAIIDDEIDHYPVQYIKDLGFEVQCYESVSFSDADKISKHDLLILDVKGVVKEDPDEGGAKLLKIIKDEKPLLPIIAVSSGTFHVELNDYFDSTNGYVRKPINEFKIRELLLELKDEFLDVEKIAKKTSKEIANLPIKKSKKRKMKAKIVGFLSDNMESKEVKSFIRQHTTVDNDNITPAVEIMKFRVSND